MLNYNTLVAGLCLENFSLSMITPHPGFPSIPLAASIPPSPASFLTFWLIFLRFRLREWGSGRAVGRRREQRRNMPIPSVCVHSFMLQKECPAVGRDQVFMGKVLQFLFPVHSRLEKRMFQWEQERTWPPGAVLRPLCAFNSNSTEKRVCYGLQGHSECRANLGWGHTSCSSSN